MSSITPTPAAIVLPVYKKYTDEQHEKAIELVDKHNEAVLATAGSKHDAPEVWYISLSGEGQVYFTLYHIIRIEGNDYYSYVQNLPTDLIEAVEKIATSKGLPIILEGEGGISMPRRIPPVCFQFGKYRGQNLVEVYHKDPQYILWAAKNTTPRNNAQKQMHENLKVIVKAHFQTLTDKNKEECSSEFYGQIKTRYDLTLKVYQVNEYFNEFENSMSYRHRATDENGNLFQFYYREELDKDTAFKLRGTVTRHQEYVGRKFTIINRVKIES